MPARATGYDIQANSLSPPFRWRWNGGHEEVAEML
jgi:hypothetical protein